MAKKKGGNDFSVSVEGLSRMRSVPGWLDRGQREFLERGSEGIRDEVRRKAPGGPNSRAGRDVESVVLTSTRAVVRSKGWPGARALERGATIRPKRGKALRLRDGRFVRGKVVVKGRRYFQKGLRSRGKIIRDAYSSAFDDLDRGGGVA